MYIIQACLWKQACCFQKFGERNCMTCTQPPCQRHVSTSYVVLYNTNDQLIDVTGVRLNVTVAGKDLRNRVTARFQRVLWACTRMRSENGLQDSHFSFFLLCPRPSEKSRRGSHNREL